MRMTLVAALGLDRAIGKDGDLLWHLPEDLKRFKALTTGHTIIMGRRTYASLPKGALPNRRNVVISRSLRSLPDAEVYPSLEAAYEQLEREGVAEAFVIGGGELYAAALPHCQALHLTIVEARFPEADTFFPEWQSEDWVELSRASYPQDERNPYPTYVLQLERRAAQ